MPHFHQFIAVIVFLAYCHRTSGSPCSASNDCHSNSTCVNDDSISRGYYCSCDQHGHFSSSVSQNGYNKNAIFPWKGQYCRSNLALGKTASQSSNNMEKPSNAMNALDITKTSGDVFNHGCSLTTVMDNPWWMVDLKKKVSVRQVLIKRADCCPAAVQIRIGNSNTGGGILNERCGELTDLNEGAYKEIYCNPALTGRFLTVIYPGTNKELAICGIEVYSDFLDFDECSAEIACVDEERMLCINTFGSFRCDCEQGRYFDKKQNICVDQDECKLGIHNCSANAYCQNTLPGYQCFCNRGFYGDGYECFDVNECANKNSDCGGDLDVSCINTLGSYKCSCSTGFQFNPQKKQCEDLDECQGAILCQTSHCMNTHGSYKCSACRDGYWMQGWVCQDLDECNHGKYSCPENEACKNNIGSYACICKEGFRRHNKLCKDIDECKTKTCPKHGECINTIGSYKCVCKQGFTEKIAKNSGMTCQRVQGVHSKNGASKISLDGSCSGSILTLVSTFLFSIYVELLP